MLRHEHEGCEHRLRQLTAQLNGEVGSRGKGGDAKAHRAMWLLTKEKTDLGTLEHSLSC